MSRNIDDTKEKQKLAVFQWAIWSKKDIFYSSIWLALNISDRLEDQMQGRLYMEIRTVGRKSAKEHYWISWFLLVVQK